MVAGPDLAERRAVAVNPVPAALRRTSNPQPFHTCRALRLSERAAFCCAGVPKAARSGIGAAITARRDSLEDSRERARLRVNSNHRRDATCEAG
jgi:hypothetical protein